MSTLTNAHVDALTGYVIVLGFVTTACAFIMGFCAKAQLVQRQIDELVIVARRPSTLATGAFERRETTMI